MWQAAVASGLVESRLLPSLGRVLTVLVRDIGGGVLPYHTAITLGRAGVGFALAAIVGVPFAAAMARSALMRNLFEPIFFFGYPVPRSRCFRSSPTFSASGHRPRSHSRFSNVSIRSWSRHIWAFAPSRCG